MRSSIEPLEPRRLLATFTVTTAADAGPGTLRQAMLDAEASPGDDTIAFALPGVGPHLVSLATPLPPLTDSVLIDATTQAGASANTLANLAAGSNAVVQVQVLGDASGGVPFVLAPAAAGSQIVLRGFAIAARGSGDAVRIVPGTGVGRVEGCFIGLDPAGNPAGSGLGVGVRVTDSASFVGGNAPAARNVIGNTAVGVLISDASTNQVLNNLVGRNPANTAARPNGTGVLLIGTASRNAIGNETGGGNLIASNTGAGIAVDDRPSGVPVGNDLVGNSIHSNGGLGIDLGDDGHTPNDDSDADTGPHALANAPAITAVDRTFGLPASRIFATLQTQPSLTVFLDFYLSPAPDPSGFGEGQTFLGGKTVIVNAQGFISTTFDTATVLPVGSIVTATATLQDPNGNVIGTSEFSNVFQVDRPAILVTSTADAGPGSLRQAIIDADHAVGPDTIRFDLPGAGPHVIQPLSPLPIIANPLTLDGSSQPGTSTAPRIVLDGSLLPAGTHHGLVVTADNVTVRGLTITRFSESGIRVDGGDEFRLLGSQVGTTPDGLASAGGRLGVLLIDSWNSRIGDSGAASRNVLSAGAPGGNPVASWILATSGHCNGSLFRNNSIGVARDGLAPLNHSAGWAVNIGSSGLLTIGGTSLSDGNVIAGAAYGGIAAVAGTWEIRNNRIGVGADNTTPLGNPGDGIVVRGSSGLVVGNQIAHNAGDGVSVVSGTARIYFNAIHSNGGLGIDLGTTGGVTPNDPLDADTGPNGLQNFPVLTRARQLPDGRFRVSGTIHTTPGTVVFLDLFASPQPDPSGHGEGQAFLDGTSLTTDASGNASFSLDVFAPTGSFITATADTLTGTSEFSRALRSYLAGDMDGNGVVNNQDIAPFVQALTDPSAYAAAFPLLSGPAIGDVNDDGTFNNQDIAPFVAALTAGRPALDASAPGSLKRPARQAPFGDRPLRALAPRPALETAAEPPPFDWIR
jgi:hypothetical protein